MTAAESFANAGIGLVVSWIATWLILGYSPGQSFGITAMFFGLSFTRAYVLRSLFRKLEDRR